VLAKEAEISNGDSLVDRRPSGLKISLVCRRAQRPGS